MHDYKIKDVLKPYIAVCETIGKTFGNQCEVVLHDLSQPENSVVYLVNPNVTDRKIGDTFDYLMNKILLKEKFNKDTLINYYFTARNGSKIKSSTVFLRDTNKKIIGAICINIKIDMFNQIQEMLDYFTGNNNQQNTNKFDISQIESIEDVIDEIISKIIPENSTNLSKARKKEIIQFLDAKGVFNSKGTIDKVALQLGISKVTVYSYMDELKKDRLDYDNI
ncbi:helix-turn-helix transcriptional regulator [Peptoniphilus porci]|uniref:YheO-like protein n=1 Tax=Peptoniphilus porci TaxID=2652280 RepID=A0A1U7LYH5_9FIRM|nr:PAS domain-containing protein [Peptoniphilus porci]OLR64346.1 hypothetical protein BIV18_01685 [Peptoniphilus porci]